MPHLAHLSFAPFDVPLLEPFGIATGAQHVAQNILIRLEMSDGTVGWGEAAPVPHISGETREHVLLRLGEVAQALAHLDLSAYRKVSSALHESLLDAPSGLCGVEIALFDALTKYYRVPLHQFFGGAESQLRTDITITTGSEAQAAQAAHRYVASGFDVLKVKIGGSDLELDRKRLLAIVAAAPTAKLILDGNTAYSAQTAVELIESLGSAKATIALFEQPTAADDIAGLAEVQTKTGITVAADESLRSRLDFQNLVRQGGVGAINIKTAKLGVVAGWDLLVAGRAHGMSIMVGGMVETELSMTLSAALAAGVGGVSFVDLDTPLLLDKRPLVGGFRQSGPDLDLSDIREGHGVTPIAGAPLIEL